MTRLGVTRAVLLSDSAFAGADTLATAYVLSLAVQKLGADLILCGRQSTDGDTAQTGPALAALLGIPVITNVLKLDVQEQRVRCMSRFGEESASLPALLTVERIAALRFPRLGAGRKDAELWDAAVLGADPERCGPVSYTPLHTTICIASSFTPDAAGLPVRYRHLSLRFLSRFHWVYLICR